jgi:hypothetical protein
MSDFIEILKEDGAVECIRKDIENYPTINAEPPEHLVNLSSQQIQEMIRNEKIRVIREKRNGLLFASDWTQTLDAPLTAEKKAEWAAYRQQLRDITNNLDILNIGVVETVFPTQPT